MYIQHTHGRVQHGDGHTSSVSNTVLKCVQHTKTHLFGFFRGVEEGVEVVRVSKLLREQEVEERPQLVQVVLRDLGLSSRD